MKVLAVSLAFLLAACSGPSKGIETKSETEKDASATEGAAVESTPAPPAEKPQSRPASSQPREAKPSSKPVQVAAKDEPAPPPAAPVAVIKTEPPVIVAEPAPVAVAPPVPPPPPPAPPAPVIRRVTVPSGTLIEVTMIDPVDSATDHVGQTFRANLHTPVTVGNETVMARGADVFVKLTAVKAAGELKGTSQLQLQLDRIVAGKKTYTLQSDVYEVKGENQSEKTVRNTGIGAAIGAVIGGIKGGAKGAAVGAGAGAGGGVAVTAIGKADQVKVPSEARLTFRLEEPLEMTIQSDAAPASTPASSGPRRLDR